MCTADLLLVRRAGAPRPTWWRHSRGTAQRRAPHPHLLYRPVLVSPVGAHPLPRVPRNRLACCGTALPSSRPLGCAWQRSGAGQQAVRRLHILVAYRDCRHPRRFVLRAGEATGARRRAVHTSHSWKLTVGLVAQAVPPDSPGISIMCLPRAWPAGVSADTELPERPACCSTALLVCRLLVFDRQRSSAP